MVQGAILSSWHLQIKHSWLGGLSLSDVVVKQMWRRPLLCFTRFLASKQKALSLSCDMGSPLPIRGFP